MGFIVYRVYMRSSSEAQDAAKSLFCLGSRAGVKSCKEEDRREYLRRTPDEKPPPLIRDYNRDPKGVY